MRILITGAARGLGAHLTDQALQRGHFVYAGIRTESASDAMKELVLRFPEHIQFLKMDVTKEYEIEQASFFIRRAGRGLDGVINNAAFFAGRDIPAQELDLAQIQKSMDVNVGGPVRVIKYFLPLLRESASACIINLSSESGSVSLARANDYPYSMSKAALNMYTEQLARSEEKIRIYAVHPGWMRTDMGGAGAPIDPADTAEKILNLLEGRQKVHSAYSFIDADGIPLPL